MARRSYKGLDTPAVLNVVRRNFVFAVMGFGKVGRGWKASCAVCCGEARFFKGGVNLRAQDRVEGNHHQMFDTFHRW